MNPSLGLGATSMSPMLHKRGDVTKAFSLCAYLGVGMQQRPQDYPETAALRTRGQEKRGT